MILSFAFVSCQEEPSATPTTRSDTLAALDLFRSRLLEDTLCDILDPPELFQDVPGYLIYTQSIGEFSIPRPHFFLRGDFEQVPWHDRGIPLEICNVRVDDTQLFDLDSLPVIFSGRADPLDENSDAESRIIYVEEIVWQEVSD